MSIVASLQEACIRELSNCQHLYTKIDPANANWRPKENMRTTLELLQYLSKIGSNFAKHFPNPIEDRDAARAAYRERSASASSVTFERFPEMIEQEKQDIINEFSKITDADLAKQTYHPFSGTEHNLFEGLLTIQNYLCAYRHQLFIYAKMMGAEINTLNNWYGRDPQPRA